ncbi:MAG TPA: hypothetical protein VMM77_06090, partial [Gemmatimonadaceae bacterium]|nr:hypothetical protein [Gemmatimonadaceae bacterium]
MLLLAALLQLAAVQSDSTGRFQITIPRYEVAVEIDGRLDEDVWSRAERITGFHQYQPVDGRPAEQRTT